MIAGKKHQKEGLPNLAELLAIMAFYKGMWPTLQTPLLLKYSGFKIKGLQGTFEGKIGKHWLAWNDTLSVGLCGCNWKGQEGWSYEMTKTQFDIHKRRHE